MNRFLTQRKIARLIVLQRIEIIGPILKKIRKTLGRRIFTNIVSKFFINPKTIGKKYYEIMQNEFNLIKEFISEKDFFFLSIGSGVGGLELIINNNFKNKKFYFIEKNYVSKKVIYNWDSKNLEAYNNLELQKNFLKENGIKEINIFDCDNDKLPNVKFDVIISLFSLDYHYDFYIYKDYLKKVCKDNTKIIFDTIRADHFNKIFKNVVVLKEYNNTVHKSKRLLCSNFLI